MSITAVRTIPTLSKSYLAGSLAAVTDPAEAPSAALNDRVSLFLGNITKLDIDAIVNAANKALLGGGGIDGAIHRAAGPELLEECRKLNGCETGRAKITKGYRLPARSVIHTVGPIYNTRKPEESRDLLRSCYEETLKLAVQNDVRTIGLCGISTGIYGYPPMEAAEVACSMVRTFLKSPMGSSLEKVVFVAFNDQDLESYLEALPRFFPKA